MVVLSPFLFFFRLFPLPFDGSVRERDSQSNGTNFTISPPYRPHTATRKGRKEKGANTHTHGDTPTSAQIFQPHTRYGQSYIVFYYRLFVVDPHSSLSFGFGVNTERHIHTYIHTYKHTHITHSKRIPKVIRFYNVKSSSSEYALDWRTVGSER